MGSISRITARWTGFLGGPGTSTFYTFSATPNIAAIRQFFNELKGGLPEEVSIQVENSGLRINEFDGEATGLWTAAPVLAVSGVGTEAYAAPAGCLVHWLTDKIIDGRALRGRTFLVPTVTTAFFGNGRLHPTWREQMRLAGNTMVSTMAEDLVVWSRPKLASTRHAAHPGSAWHVLNVSIPDKPAIMKSRRD